MRARGSAHASLLLSSGTSTSSIGWYVAASFVVHVLFFVIAIYLPDLAPKREFVPSVIMVNMVTMSPTGSIGKPGHPGPEKPGPKSEKPAAPNPGPAKPEVQESKPEPPAPKPAKPEVQEPKPVPPAPKPEKVSVPEPKPEPEKSADVISLSNEKPKIKTSLKKETFKSSQAIKNALNRIEKQVEETKPVDPLASALDRIKSKVEKAESETARSSSKEPASGKSSGAGSGSGAVGGSGGGTGGTGGTGAFGIQPIDFYRSLIPNHIENHWVFNEQLVGGRTDLVSVIVIKIMKNGEITDIWFEKKSGNSYFDDSVYKAVKKSNPLPPLPREYAQPYYELGLIFTPKGLKRS